MSAMRSGHGSKLLVTAFPDTTSMAVDVQLAGKRSAYRTVVFDPVFFTNFIHQ